MAEILHEQDKNVNFVLLLNFVSPVSLLGSRSYCETWKTYFRIRIGIFIVPIQVCKEICLTVHSRKYNKQQTNILTSDPFWLAYWCHERCMMCDEHRCCSQTTSCWLHRHPERGWAIHATSWSCWTESTSPCATRTVCRNSSSPRGWASAGNRSRSVVCFSFVSLPLPPPPTPSPLQVCLLFWVVVFLFVPFSFSKKRRNFCLCVCVCVRARVCACVCVWGGGVRGVCVCICGYWYCYCCCYFPSSPPSSSSASHCMKCATITGRSTASFSHVTLRCMVAVRVTVCIRIFAAW